MYLIHKIQTTFIDGNLHGATYLELFEYTIDTTITKIVEKITICYRINTVDRHIM